MALCMPTRTQKATPPSPRRPSLELSWAAKGKHKREICLQHLTVPSVHVPPKWMAHLSPNTHSMLYRRSMFSNAQFNPRHCKASQAKRYPSIFAAFTSSSDFFFTASLIAPCAQTVLHYTLGLHPNRNLPPFRLAPNQLLLWDQLPLSIPGCDAQTRASHAWHRSSSRSGASISASAF